MGRVKCAPPQAAAAAHVPIAGYAHLTGQLSAQLSVGDLGYEIPWICTIHTHPYLRPACVRSLTPTRRTHRSTPTAHRLCAIASPVSETIKFVRSSHRVLDMKVFIARPPRDTVCKVYMISEIRTRPLYQLAAAPWVDLVSPLEHKSRLRGHVAAEHKHVTNLQHNLH